MSRHRPPALAVRILSLTAPRDRRDAQVGDLVEEFGDRVARDPASAHRWALRQAIGSVGPNLALRAERVLSRTNVMSREGTMKGVLGDLRPTLRGMRRDLAFHSVVVLTVGLGIGAVSTMFSVVHGLVLNAFPFPEPERIVGVGTAYPRLGASLGFFENLSPAEYLDIRARSTTLDDIVAWDMGNRQIDSEGPPENVFTAFWWGDPLTTVQMRPWLGRGFAEDEIRQGSTVAMISYDLWRSRFGADSTMVGGGISINGTPYTLVGIFPEGVDIYGTDLWTLMPVGPEAYARNRRQFQVMGRIRDGATLEGVNAELATIASVVAQEHGSEFEEYQGWSMRAMTWGDVNSRVFRTGVFALMGAVLFVLLLVCANTANLLLARAQRRRREMAVRTALGAGRSRIVGQLLTESVTLAALGGVLGIFVAGAGVRGVTAFLDTIGLNIAGAVEVNGAVMAVTALVALGAGIVFGLAPALQASGVAVAATLQSETRGATAGGSRQRLQRGLVGVQVMLAFVLLAGGGLLVNSFIRVNQVDTGFEPDDVLTFRVTLPREEYEGDAVAGFFRTLVERIEAIPGVRSAGAGTQFPPVAFSFLQVFFDGAEANAEATLPTVLATVVTPGYFQALGIPLLRGRTLDQRDRTDAPLAAVVNEEAARRYFGDTDPVGRRLKLGDADEGTPWWEIVGVVGSTRNLGLDRDPFPEIFAVHDQVGASQNQLFVIVRTDGDPMAFVPAVREAVLELDADQPVYAIRSIEASYQAGIAAMRAATLLFSAFALFALILAAVGIYAVVAFTVSERTQEIGLRVALGAGRGRVRRLVVRQALLPVLAGASIGLVGAVAMSTGLERLLFDVRGTDPLTLGSVGALLVGVAVLASWLPAWRASRLDPVEALRAE